MGGRTTNIGPFLKIAKSFFCFVFCRCRCRHRRRRRPTTARPRPVLLLLLSLVVLTAAEVGAKASRFNKPIDLRRLAEDWGDDDDDENGDGFRDHSGSEGRERSEGEEEGVAVDAHAIKRRLQQVGHSMTEQQRRGEDNNNGGDAVGKKAARGGGSVMVPEEPVTFTDAEMKAVLAAAGKKMPQPNARREAGAGAGTIRMGIAHLVPDPGRVTKADAERLVVDRWQKLLMSGGVVANGGATSKDSAVFTDQRGGADLERIRDFALGRPETEKFTVDGRDYYPVCEDYLPAC